MYQGKLQYHVQLYVLRAVLLFSIFYICLLNIIHIPRKHQRQNQHKSFPYSPKKDRITGKPYNAKTYSLKVDFASDESGAKIVAHSRSLGHVSSIQQKDRNTYMLSPCKDDDWFILSFPESIFIEKIALLSFEYYASTYKYVVFLLLYLFDVGI